MKLTSIKWEAIIDGKKYGSSIKEIDLGKKKFTREIITDIVKVIAEQMNQSLQKIITGKSSMDVLAEDVEKLYELAGTTISPKEYRKAAQRHEKLWRETRIR